MIRMIKIIAVFICLKIFELFKGLLYSFPKSIFQGIANNIDVISCICLILIATVSLCFGVSGIAIYFVGNTPQDKIVSMYLMSWGFGIFAIAGGLYLLHNNFYEIRALFKDNWMKACDIIDNDNKMNFWLKVIGQFFKQKAEEIWWFITSFWIPIVVILGIVAISYCYYFAIPIMENNVMVNLDSNFTESANIFARIGIGYCSLIIHLMIYAVGILLFVLPLVCFLAILGLLYGAFNKFSYDISKRFGVILIPIISYVNYYILTTPIFISNTSSDSPLIKLEWMDNYFTNSCEIFVGFILSLIVTGMLSVTISWIWNNAKDAYREIKYKDKDKLK